MILTDFPDLKWLKTQAEEHFASRKAWDGSLLPNSGWPTVLMNANTKNIFRDNIRGPLSIFMNLSGTSMVSTDTSRYKVRDGFFCLTNAGQHYTLEIESHPAETFNFHFGEHMADQFAASLENTEDQQLEFHSISSPAEFKERLQPVPDTIKHIVAYIKANPSIGPLELEELTSQVLAILMMEEQNIRKKQNDLDALKVSTREEVTKRLRLAANYIYENYATDISLDELTRAACLSKFHLLRQFKNYYKQTPHQFLNDVRIGRAKELLKSADLNVKSIARDTGFKDSSTFSRLFARKTGVYPSAYRNLAH